MIACYTTHYSFSSVMNQEAMEKKDGGLFHDLGVDGKAPDDDPSRAGFLTGLSLMMPVKPMLALYSLYPPFPPLLTLQQGMSQHE
jgi:hypothetical protein